MRRNAIGAMVVMLIVALEATTLAGAPAQTAQAVERFQTAPAAFVQNQGQWDDKGIRFVLNSPAAAVAVTDAGLKFQVLKREAVPLASAASPSPGTPAPAPFATKRFAFSLQFEGAQPVAPSGLDQSQGVHNFRIGDQSRWRENVPGYNQVTYAGLYPGIDLKLSGQNAGIKYEFVVQPGADPKQIRLHYQGIRSLAVGADGALAIDLAEDWAPLTDGAPLIYQDIDGRRVAVAGRFVLLDNLTHGFEITGAYDASRPLVIDPVVEWGTYLGGSGTEYECIAVAVDPSGNVVVATQTSSSTGWVSVGPDTTYNGGGFDIALVKLSSAGAHLWSTYLGGSNEDLPLDIAVDAAGNIFIVGYTLSDGWVSGSADSVFDGGTLYVSDGFLAKLSSTGGHIWSRYIGGSGDDFISRLRLDGTGHIFVVGQTQSAGLASGGYDQTYGGDWDGLVMKLDSTGALIWSTYLGGDGFDTGLALAVDGSGNVVVSGSTNTSGWVNGGFDISFNGGEYDGFVVKLSGAGNHLWSTYIGSENREYIPCIEVDGLGNIYLAGSTAGAISWIAGGFDPNFNGSGYLDSFVVKFSSAGAHLWSTYLGGDDNEDMRGLALDLGGNPIVIGDTYSSGWVSNGFDTTFDGGPRDGFIAKLSTDGAHIWSSYIGGSGFEKLQDVTTDTNGRIYVVGSTQQGGWLSGGYDTTYDGNADAFVLKIADFTPAISWSSYLGGSGADWGCSLATDSAGNVIVVGWTTSAGWVSGGFDTSYAGGGTSGQDAFVVKLSASGSHIWSTYLGGDDTDQAFSVATDSADNILVTGLTYSSGWVSGGWLTTHMGEGASGMDGFVAKLSPGGSHLWSSYIGGNSGDSGYAIDVDSAGNVFVAGNTYSTGWVSGGYDDSFNGGRDPFVVKLSPSGQHLWSTYTGGEDAYGLATDSDGNVIVTGWTYSGDWVSGGYDLDFNGGTRDGFAVKISAAGQHVWSTFFGGSGDEHGEALATDSQGNIYITGSTNSAGWVSGGFDPSHNGDYDPYVLKLAPGGQHLWSTYLGGSAKEEGVHGLAVDRAGDVLVAGSTLSTGWVSGGFDDTSDGTYHGFVAKLSSSGSHLWSSFIVGGGQHDVRYDVDVNSTGDIFVTGTTSTAGWANGGYDTTLEGPTDGFVAKIRDVALATGQQAVFMDDFNDNAIDPAKWRIGGSSVSENGGMMKIDQAGTDNGGQLTTALININPNDSITITRRILIHYASNYFYGKFRVTPIQAPELTFTMVYGNYTYASQPYCAYEGFYIARYGQNPTYCSAWDDVSSRIEPVWDSWFDEKIIYHPTTGIVEYFVNDQKRLDYFVGILPATVSQLEIYTAPEGWGTGHYIYLDDVAVSQATVNPDADSDTLPDTWEQANFGNLDQTADGDPDNDGLTNLQEYTAGTNPNSDDSDDDGMKDGWETANGLNPLANDAGADPDGDKFTNGREFQDGTDPANAASHLILPQTGRIPDTGQTKCYDNTQEIPCPTSGQAFYGQDANYLINPPQYIKMDEQGRYLADSATSWAMVYDVVTGLIWENKTDDGSIQDKDNTYTWDNAQSVFIAGLNGANFGGHADWRLPSVKELASIVDFGRTNPSINTAFFPNTGAIYYWSSSSHFGTSGSAWFVDFVSGGVYSNYKSNSYCVRAVRSGQTRSLSHLVFNGDGTVTDTANGLMWQQGNPGTKTWGDALTYCETLTLSGHSDWRLPNATELEAITDHNQQNPSIDATVFPGTAAYAYWSSSSAGNSSNAWYVDFESGGVSNLVKSNSYYVRAVRGGQSRSLGRLFIWMPAQGGFWDIGSQQTITWDTAGLGGDVAISLSRDGGKTYETIIANTPNDGAFDWTVTGPTSVNCALKIEPLSDPTKATVQSLFTIKSLFAGFTDTASTAGVNVDTSGEWASAWGDIDNDGDLDLAWTNKNGTDQLRRNNGNGTFTNISGNLGTSDGRAIVMGDYDNDGDLDIYINKDTVRQLLQNNGAGQFTDVSSQAGISHNCGSYNASAAFGDYDADGDLDLYVGTNELCASTLYRNNGDGTFTDVTAQAGVGLEGRNTTGVHFADFNGDGHLDILAINSGLYAKSLLTNNGNGTFTDTAQAAGIALAADDVFSADVGDIDNDGDMDLVFSSQQHPAHILLFENNGQGVFTDITAGSGLQAATGVETAVLFADLNNDGWLDVYISTGELGNKDQVFIANGDHTYTEVSNLLDLTGTDSHHCGCPVIGDYDNDGDLDIFLNPHYGTSQLFQNLTNSGNYLKIDLLGVASNRYGLGAKVSVWKTGDAKTGANLKGYRQVNANGDHHSMRTTQLHFGLDAGATYDIQVRWPSGITQVLEAVTTGQTLTIAETQADTDADTLPDAWEQTNFGNLNQTAAGDADSDGLTNLQEYTAGTNPNSDDSDGDGMKDDWEISHSLNPLANDAGADPDADNFTNGREFQDGTDPANAASHYVLPPVTGRIPDTGQTKCYDNAQEIPCPQDGQAFFGQDGSYLINPPQYIKMDEQGRYLADSATSWAMVYDVVTGLVWEIKTDDGSIHDKDNTYTWDDAQSVFITGLNSANFGGYSDWRMPTPKELAIIADQSAYWSSLSRVGNSSNAWFVHFSNGLVSTTLKSISFYVRAVRSGQARSMGNLVINGDGTVTDTATGLMWQQANPGTKTWEQALIYCENLTLAGHSDWRLPNATELHSIVDYSRYDPSIDTASFPGTAASVYWSSSPRDSDSAWYVYFDEGFVAHNWKSFSYDVRAVRSGQTQILGHLVIWAPAQGGFWDIGSQQTITWDTAGIAGNVAIYLSRDGGKTYETITASTPNDGSFDWTVTGPSSYNCALKIEPLSDPTKATVQSLFTIKLGDDFNGNLSSAWRITNPDPAKYSLGENPGWLRLYTTATDLWGNYNNPTNLFTMPLPVELTAYEVIAKLRFGTSPSANYQQGGILLLADAAGQPDQDNYLRIQYAYENGLRVEAVHDVNGTATVDPGTAINIGTNPIWLKLVHFPSGTTAYYSLDGTTYSPFFGPFAHSQAMAHVGLFALNGVGTGAASIPVDFDFFQVRQLSTPANAAPNTPATPQPPASASNISINAALSWTGGDPDAGDTVTYDVYFGTAANPPLVSSAQSALTYSPSPMAYSQTYYWKIVAKDNNGNTTTGPIWSFATLAAPDTTAPSVPGGLQATPAANTWTNDNTIQVTWTAATDNIAVAGYSYLWDTNPATDPDATSETSSLSAVSAGLSDGTGHYFHVRAIDTAGNPGPSAHIGPFKIDTTGPAGTVSINNGATTTGSSAVTLNLSASDAGSGLASMRFSNDGTNWSTAQAYSVTAAWTLVTGTGTRTVHAQFADALGNWGSTASDTIEVSAAPPDPTGFGLNLVGDGTVQLKWTYPTSPPGLTYRVYRSEQAGGIFYEVTTQPVDSGDVAFGKAYFTDWGLENGKSYNYMVRAFNGDTPSVGFSTKVAAAPVQAFNFELKPARPGAIVNVSGTTAFDVNLLPLEGYTGTVQLSCIGLPQGVAWNFKINGVSAGTNPSVAQLPAAVRLEITAGSATPLGEHGFAVYAQNTWPGGNSAFMQKPLNLTVVSMSGKGIHVEVEKNKVRKAQTAKILGGIYPWLSGKSVHLTLTPESGQALTRNVVTGTLGRFEVADWVATLGIGLYELTGTWTDDQGNAHTSESRYLEVEKGQAVLTCLRQSGVAAVRNQDFTIQGAIAPAVVGVPLTLRAIDPDGVHADYTVWTDDQGGYSITYPFFNKTGIWKFKTYWEGDAEHIGCESEYLSVGVEVEAGRSIILGGGYADQSNTYWEATKKLTVDAYRDFKAKGYTNAMICYAIHSQAIDINYDDVPDSVVDIYPPTANDFTNAIRNHFSGQLNAQSVLFVYMQGHGFANATFQVLGTDELVSATQIAAALTDVQAATGCKVVLMLEACYSGTFIPALSGANRVILTSVGNAAYNTDASARNTFSRFLFAKLREGKSIRSAFVYARDEMQKLGYPSPQLDDNGDGVANDNDGLMAAGLYLTGTLTWGAPVISAVSLPEVVENTVSAPIAVTLTQGDTDILSVTAQVIPPGADLTGGAGLVSFPEIPLVFNSTSGRFEGTLTGLAASGIYKVSIQAENTEHEVSAPSIHYVGVAAEAVPGDVDADGAVTLADAILALKAATGAVTTGITTAADVNGDGKIGLAEAVYAIQKVAGMR